MAGIMKRIIFLLLIPFMVGTLFIACDNNNEPNGNDPINNDPDPDETTIVNGVTVFAYEPDGNILKGSIDVTSDTMEVRSFALYYKLQSEDGLPGPYGSCVNEEDASMTIQWNTDRTHCDFSCNFQRTTEPVKYRMVAKVFRGDIKLGNAFSEVKYFTPTTDGSSDVSLSIDDITELGSSFAVCNASIITQKDSSAFINATCGFCWAVSATTEMPTLQNNVIDCTAAALANQGRFSTRIENLTANTYHAVRAYLTMDGQTIYSDSRQFFTNADGGEDDSESIELIQTGFTTTTASFHIVAKINSGTPTAGGLCYNTTGTPLSGENTVDCLTEAAAGDGVFNKTITGLSSGTNYYVRAYVVVNSETRYSNEVHFTTESPK